MGDFKFPHEFFINNFSKITTSNVVLDLLDVFSEIYIADITNKKNNGKRNIMLSIGVTDPELWTNNINLLKELINFVAADDYDFVFTSCKKSTTAQGSLFGNTFSCNTLLSGGLDSFCGAYYNYSRGIDSIYTSYQTSTYDIPHQVIIHDFISQKIKNLESFIFGKVPFKKIEYTQRTRSLLFMALAVVVANHYNCQQVRIYENGVMSLNPVLFGRYTTKTTHPRTIFLFNKILANIDVNIIVSNEFFFRTKGSIINDLDEDFRNQIKSTTSCSMSRQNKYVDDRQCGFCAPCILRKISLSAYDLEQYDRDYTVGYGVKIKDIHKEYIRSEYKSSVEYFKKYKETIDSEEIFAYIMLKQEYFSSPRYIEQTYQMLAEFSGEVERYLSKYELY